MGDVDFFLRTRDSDGATLIISQPAEGRGGLQGKQVVRFTRRIDKSDGSFGGVILIAVEVDYLLSFPDIDKSSGDKTSRG